MIDKDFFKTISDNIKTTLREELGLTGDQAQKRAQGYLIEDNSVAEERSALLEKKRVLEGVKRALFAVSELAD